MKKLKIFIFAFMLILLFVKIINVFADDEVIEEWREPLPYYSPIRSGYDDIASQFSFANSILAYDYASSHFILVPLSSDVARVEVRTTFRSGGGNYSTLYFKDVNDNYISNFAYAGNAYAYWIWNGEYFEPFNNQRNYIEYLSSIDTIGNIFQPFTLQQIQFLYQNFYSTISVYYRQTDPLTGQVTFPYIFGPIMFSRQSTLGDITPIDFYDMQIFDPTYELSEPKQTTWWEKVQNAFDDATSITDIPTLLRDLFKLVLEGLANIGDAIVNAPRNFALAIQELFVPSQEDLRELENAVPVDELSNFNNALISYFYVTDEIYPPDVPSFTVTGTQLSVDNSKALVSWSGIIDTLDNHFFNKTFFGRDIFYFLILLGLAIYVIKYIFTILYKM